MYALPNISRAAGAEPYKPKAMPVRHGLLGLLARVRFQLLGGLLIAVVIPALLRLEFRLPTPGGSVQNSVIATSVAVIVAAYAVRKLIPFPGVQATSFILPAFAAAYAMIAIALLLFRIEYSRFLLFASFLLAVPWFWFVLTIERRFKRPRLALVPAGNTAALAELPHADWRFIEDSGQVPDGVSGVVADLKSGLSPVWEKLLATCALEGLPVYHSKHVAESLTGRVEIEHLSENSLGSLLPSSIYLKFKRSCDTAIALVFLPLLLPFFGVVALLIKLEDGGPIRFTQARMGHRGQVFAIFKFRTMLIEPGGADFTEGDDPRITKIGKLLRRYRIDELPQIFNIIRGEMSWIGPRPESLPLAEWYERKIPFYSYRHIVRPGITGWAQVQQGWAAEVKDVTGKLHYDFFYIKHFSPWLDLLILARTVRTVLTGFGAR